MSRSIPHLVLTTFMSRSIPHLVITTFAMPSLTTQLSLNSMAMNSIWPRGLVIRTGLKVISAKIGKILQMHSSCQIKDLFTLLTWSVKQKSILVRNGRLTWHPTNACYPKTGSKIMVYMLDSKLHSEQTTLTYIKQ